MKSMAITATCLASLELVALGTLPVQAQGSVPQADASLVARSMADVCDDCVARKFTACGRFLEGPAFDRDGNMWVVSIQGGDIHKVTL